MQLIAINAFVVANMKTLEMTGVLMRIFSFSLVSWMGPLSPFMFVWVFNTTDAVLLTWCAVPRRDSAYTVLNGFWILVGLVGMATMSKDLLEPLPGLKGRGSLTIPVSIA